MKNLITKSLLVLSSISLLSSCCNIAAKGSLKDKSIITKNFGNAPSWYQMPTKKGKLVIEQDIGKCGAGISFLLIFPMQISKNTCEDNFRVKVDLEKIGINYKNILIKYNNKIYNSVEEDGAGNSVFKGINTDELKQSKDAVIIIKDGDEVIAELPFEWGVSVYI